MSLAIAVRTSVKDPAVQFDAIRQYNTDSVFKPETQSLQNQVNFFTVVTSLRVKKRNKLAINVGFIGYIVIIRSQFPIIHKTNTIIKRLMIKKKNI